MAKAKAKQTKQKAKDKKPAKATKAVAKKAETTPDWLRKAMAIPPKRKGRPPGSKNRPKIEPQTLKRGKKPMANIGKDQTPLYDPEKDPDFRAKDEALITPAPPKPDQALPGNPIKPGKPAPLPGGGVLPEKKHKGTVLVEEREPEPEHQFDEVQSGAEIPDENLQALIAGTMGGSGDNHAMAKRIVERMHQANWTNPTKALDEGTGDTRSKALKPNASIKPNDRKDDERKDDKR